jgi:uncharacterized NAD(P)/FAD-binding protein YdhS
VSNAVIVGGGASGVISAAQLACVCERVTVVERGRTFGRGIAYGTQSDAHLLNTRAGVMSAFHADPGHFLSWIQPHISGTGEESYLPRRRYAEYLGSVLDDLLDGHTPAKVETVFDEAVAVDVADGRPAVRTREGRRLGADYVVLAVGHGAPSTLPALEPLLGLGDVYAPDPWAPRALEGLSGAEPVLLVGAGLTAVDVLLSLDERGHTGPVTAVSRHGLLPTGHLSPRPRVLDVELDMRSARTALCSLRDRVRAAERAGEDWRGVIDGLRHTADGLWSCLPTAEQVTFLRSLLRYWEIHRHRMAPPVAETVNAHRRSGRFELVAGHGLRPVQHTSATVTMGFVSKEGARVHSYRRVINCTGPTSPLRAPSSLIADLLGQGLLHVDPLGLGAVTDEYARTLAAGGSVTDWLRIVGPLRRGVRYWETTAVPDIREHAAAVADSLAG